MMILRSSGHFSNAEIEKFLSRYENRYNIPEPKYVEWLKSHDLAAAKKLLSEPLLVFCWV